MTDEGGSSTISFFPTTSGEPGDSIACSASNSLGWQAVPCTFHLVIAAPPPAPPDCTIIDLTHSSFGVRCPGPPSGPPDLAFKLVVTVSVTGAEVWRAEERKPQFQVGGLAAGTSYTVKLWATSRTGGAGPPSYLATATPGPPDTAERRLRAGRAGLLPAALVAIGLALSAGLIGCWLVMRKVSSRAAAEQTGQHADRNQHVPLSDQVAHFACMHYEDLT